MKVAFCGLGNMGTLMATRLLEAGHEMTAWNRTTERTVELGARGATVASTPAAAASGADVVITMLADDQAVESVYFGPDGIAEGLHTGAVVVDMSTVAPDTARSLASRMPEGIGVLEAPVKGGPARAAEGRLRILVGGEEATFEHVRPLLSAMGEPRHVGPTGSAAAAKVLNNYAVIVLVSVLGEALVLADALGMDEAFALEVLQGTPLEATVLHQWPRATGAARPSFKMRLAAKDLNLALDAARSAGLDLPIAEEARGRMDRAIAQGMGQDDQAGVVRSIRRGESIEGHPRG
ncbi:MAG: NAD(P)-dependent oxidoreductase [Actinobacteria bacterium]|nr:NAD(P)-dependent oxidoreductase [Actinomycetota bacterium]